MADKIVVGRYARSDGERSIGGSARRAGGFAGSGLGRSVGSERTRDSGASRRDLGRRGAFGGIAAAGIRSVARQSCTKPMLRHAAWLMSGNALHYFDSGWNLALVHEHG